MPDYAHRITAELAALRDSLKESQRANTEWARECDDLRAELEGYRNGNRDLHDECQALRAERDRARYTAGRLTQTVERMRGVVEAACDWRTFPYDEGEIGDLIREVDAYRAASSEQEATDA